MSSNSFSKNICTFIPVFIFLIIISSCTDKPFPLEPDQYIPDPLVNSTWDLIDDPESAGWSLQKLQIAHAFSTEIETAAVMIIYRGEVLFYWGEIERKFWLHSCRKSLLSALYGIYVDAGIIDLDKTMAELNINDSPSTLSETEKTATVRMLLQARSGIYIEAALEAPSMKAARPERHSHAPGTFWYYNNWDFNALGTIFEQETGKKIFEAFNERIAGPLEMEDFEIEDGIYVYEPTSVHPGYPVRMSARDMARFGQLFLQNGLWNGNRILTEEWIDESTASYSDAGDFGGYGYMWWVASNGNHLPAVSLPDGCYSARGAYGQYVLVLPHRDLVIVHRVNSDIDDNVNNFEFGILTGLILDAWHGQN